MHFVSLRFYKIEREVEAWLPIFSLRASRQKFGAKRKNRIKENQIVNHVLHDTMLRRQTDDDRTEVRRHCSNPFLHCTNPFLHC